MSAASRDVSSIGDLMAAAADPAVRNILVGAVLEDVPTLQLLPGQMLSGTGEEAGLRFAPGVDGVRLCTDNRVENLALVADRDRCALFNDTAVAGLGRIELHGLRLWGSVRLVAADAVRSGHVEVHDVHVVAADARGWNQRPAGFGVEVVAGAFTLWNRQADPAATITSELRGVSVGLAGAPVQGGGVFVGGAGATGGRLVVRLFETGPVHSDGGIAPGTADRISGGVFVVHGAVVDEVRCRGPVTTYGPNDMALDNWGTVDRWIAEAKVTTHGPSGIGFVNFGTIDVLEVLAPIETFGGGARGFNVYAGTVRTATFERIVTHADGAVGIQISQPVGRIAVRRGIETHGGIGDSLVKGMVTPLPATALSVKPGGMVREIEIAGGLLAHGKGTDALELRGAIGSLVVTGGLAVEEGQD